jgi:hypothetical protein
VAKMRVTRNVYRIFVGISLGKYTLDCRLVVLDFGIRVMHKTITTSVYKLNENIPHFKYFTFLQYGFNLFLAIN